VRLENGPERPPCQAATAPLQGPLTGRAEISRTLNDKGIADENGAPWSPSRVRQVLTNEKYAGVLVFGRTAGRLSQATQRRPRAAWLRLRCLIPPIVSREMFELAQRNIVCRR
jgi:hypothetical protein